MFLRKLADSAFAAAGFVWMVGGLFLHIYTIIVAYSVSGLVAAVGSFLMPLVAQVFWFIWFWWKAGTPINGYGFYVLAYIAWVGGMFAIAATLSWLASRADK